MSLLQRLLSPIVDVRREETNTALMMFGYSFLAMTAYNIVQPITRSRFITSLGSENIPYVLLVSAFIVGFIMQGYSRLGSLIPGRWVIPVTQAGIVGLGTRLGAGIGGFAAFTVGLTVVWLAVAAQIAREHRRRTV